jgi:hypothetical protein
MKVNRIIARLMLSVAVIIGCKLQAKSTEKSASQELPVECR